MVCTVLVRGVGVGRTGASGATLVIACGDLGVKRIVAGVAPAFAAFVRVGIAPAAAIGCFLFGLWLSARTFAAAGVIPAPGPAFGVAAGCRSFRPVPVGHRSSPVCRLAPSQPRAGQGSPWLVYSNGGGNTASRPAAS